MEIQEIKQKVKEQGVYSAVPSLSSYGDHMITLSYQSMNCYYEMCILTSGIIHEEMTFGEILEISDINGVDFEYLSFTAYKTEQTRILSIDFAPLRDDG